MIRYEEHIVTLLNNRGWNVYARVMGTENEEVDTIRAGPVTRIVPGTRYALLPVCDNPRDVVCVRAAVDRLPAILGREGHNVELYNQPDQVLGFTAHSNTIKLSNPSGDLLNRMAFLDLCESIRKIN